jgi:hypothetical protein
MIGAWGSSPGPRRAPSPAFVSFHEPELRVRCGRGRPPYLQEAA